MSRDIRKMMGLEPDIPIEELRKPITLWVTEEDKQIGHPRDGFACTGAVCLQRAFAADKVLVGLRVVYIFSDGHLYKGQVTAKLRNNVIIPNDEERYGDILIGPYDILPLQKTERGDAPAKRRADLRKRQADGTAPPPVSRGSFVTYHFRRI